MSSSVGMGKTTFIYHLVGQLLDKGYLPLVFSCQEIEDEKPNTEKKIKAYFAEKYEGKAEGQLKQETIQDILESNRGKIIVLLDGLDQIRVDDHAYISGLIENSCGNYPYLITSRPSAVNHLETRCDCVFLRLQLFSHNALTSFFGDRYEKARELTAFTPDLIRTPMLAYMVKKHLEESSIQNVQTRTELYQAFVSYILREQNKKEFKPTTARNIIQNLQRISYTALALDKPQIQKVSLDHCFKKLQDISCEELTTYGLVNLAIEKSDFLYFTHQSFQEYFAACYVIENQELIDVIEKQQWHPKWKEVIKFLAGLMGVEFVKRIYSREDNVIHSRLFLAVECITELKEKTGEYIKEVKKDLDSIPYDSPFQYSIIKAQIELGNADYVLNLLHEKDNDIRTMTIKALRQIGTPLPVTIISQLIKLFDDQDRDIRTNAAETLGNAVKLHQEFIQQLVTLLSNQDPWIRSCAAEALGYASNLQPDSIIDQLSELLHDKDSHVRESAARALGSFGNFLPKAIITQLGELLHDKDEWVRRNAADTLGMIGGPLSDAIIDQLSKIIYEQRSYAAYGALDALKKINCHRSNTNIKSLIYQQGKLLNESYVVRKDAAYALRCIGGILPEYIIVRLGKLLHDHDEMVRVHAAAALGSIDNQLPEEIICELGNLLSDSSSLVCRYAARALGMSGILPPHIIKQLGKLLHDDYSAIRSWAIYALKSTNDLPQEIIRQLGELLCDKDNSVRKKAVEALGKMSSQLPKAIIKQMVELLHDTDCNVRQSAFEVLIRLFERGELEKAGADNF